MTAEPAVGEVYGFRTWDVQTVVEWTGLRDGLVWRTCLVGAKGHRWDGSVQHARCRNRLRELARAEWGEEQRAWWPEREHPMLGCTCGFYATDRAAVERYMREVRRPVLGVVAGWGETVVGEKGWRSSQAQVVGLVEPRLRGRRTCALDVALTVVSVMAIFAAAASLAAVGAFALPSAADVRGWGVSPWTSVVQAGVFAVWAGLGFLWYLGVKRLSLRASRALNHRLGDGRWPHRRMADAQAAFAAARAALPDAEVFACAADAERWVVRRSATVE